MPTRIEVVRDAAHIRFEYPERRNGLDEALCDELLAAFDNCAEREEVRFLVLHGAPDWFCIGGGGDYLERAIRASGELRADFTRRVQQVIFRFFDHELLTVTVLDGLAAAAGADLLFASDLVLATPKARLSLLYSKLGLVPDVGFALMERRLGAAQALQLYAESQVLDQAGLVALGVASETEFDPTDAAALTSYLGRRFRHQRAAFADAKRLAGLSWSQRLRLEADLAARMQAKAFGHPQTQERLLRSAGMQRAL